MQKLPIGIQTFSDIRTQNYCYADKTELIAQLTDQGKFYFLSRPRRFGKSLLIDTIAEAFLGNKKLFKKPRALIFALSCSQAYQSFLKYPFFPA